jgi:hypothetical protein
MDLENAAASVPPQDGAAADPAIESARRRRRRKAKAEAASAAGLSGIVPAATKVETEAPRNADNAPISAAAPQNAEPSTIPIKPAPTATPRAISVLPPTSEPRKQAAAKSSFIKRHGALAAGMVLALGLGAYAGTQLGMDGSNAGVTANGLSVNVAAALPWKRDVAMASTQAREITRLKEELRGVRAQVDALKTNPDQARQAQELRSLRASLETLKEGVTAMRSDTANAIAQVSTQQTPKTAERDQQRVEKIAERLERLERQMADPTPTAAIAHKADAPKPASQPDPHALPTPAEVAAAGQKVEVRPKVIQNYVLREVADGVALIEGPDGLREVWPGRGVPGAGKVTSIERQAGKWVVITSDGVIEFKRDAYSRN